MSDNLPPRHESLPHQLLWILRYRRSQLPSIVRDKLLFYSAWGWRAFFGIAPGIHLGDNVRLQRNRCVFAEAPEARVHIGDNSIVFERAKVEAFGSGKIHLGANCVLGDTRISCRHEVNIGSRFLSSWNVLIQDFDPHPVNPGERAVQIDEIVHYYKPYLGSSLPKPAPKSPWSFPGAPIHIGDNVWVGANVLILKGAKIGNGCVVAAGSVVTAGEYAENTLVAGNPAQSIKHIS